MEILFNKIVVIQKSKNVYNMNIYIKLYVSQMADETTMCKLKI